MMELQARLKTPYGILVVSESGDGEEYAGIKVELEHEKGTSLLAIVETAIDEWKAPDPIYPTKFHTLAYTGCDEEPVRIDFDECGEYALD